MPYSLEISESTGVAILTINGQISFEEYVEVSKEIWQTPHYKSRAMWDLRNGLLRPSE